MLRGPRKEGLKLVLGIKKTEGKDTLHDHNIYRCCKNDLKKHVLVVNVSHEANNWE